MPPKKKSKQEPGIKNGKIVLKSTITQIEKNAVQKLAKRINLNGFRWEIIDGLFTQCNMRSILENTQELNINHLGLANNKHKNILRDLTVFNPYSKLQNLIMPGNNIESIEAIVYLNAPLLWRVDFGENNIREMKAFRKMHCPNLVMFRIEDNKISDLGEFETCYCPALMEITLRNNKYLSNIVPLIKMQSEEFRQIYAHTCGIIASSRLCQVFKQKNKQISIAL